MKGGAEKVIVHETERLILTVLTDDDAPFILGLLNEPSFLRYVGDKGVRSLEDAREYIQSGPVSTYSTFGFGGFLTSVKDSGIPIGICGLLNREELSGPDIGYAFIPESWGKGYATEAVTAVVTHAQKKLNMDRILAIVAEENHRSIRLLESIGFRYESMTRLTAEDQELKLYALGRNS